MVIQPVLFSFHFNIRIRFRSLRELLGSIVSIEIAVTSVLEMSHSLWSVACVGCLEIVLPIGTGLNALRMHFSLIKSSEIDLVHLLTSGLLIIPSLLFFFLTLSAIMRPSSIFVHFFKIKLLLLFLIMANSLEFILLILLMQILLT